MTTNSVPQSLGRYRALRVLDDDVARIRYLARDRVRDRLVTVTVILAAGLNGATRIRDLKQFKAEAKAVGRCRHPGILALHAYAEEGGMPFIVMEHVDGSTLQQALADPAARAALDPVGIALQILDGLDHGHRLGLVHRDLRPATILLTAAGRVKIAEFGIDPIGRAVQTHDVAVVATPNYLAPEQACGAPVDQRADLFAAGAILYEMLAGKPPFQGRTPTETLSRLLGAGPAALTAIPPALAPALQRALAKVPEERFQTAVEFAAALPRAAQPAAAAEAGLPATVPRITADAEARAASPIAPAPAGAAEEPIAAGDAGDWSRDFLEELESILAPSLGPVAGALIRNAARRTTSTDELYLMLAASLTKPAQRTEFRRRVARLRPGSTAAASSAPSAPAAPAAPPALSAEALQAAQTALAQYLGPIAKVLVRQAADRASSSADFCESLAANLPKPAEAAAFRRKLAQDLDRLLSS